MSAAIKPTAATVTRVSDAVAAELENRILDGSLKPGERLTPERELSVEMGVSRPSLREAIRKLVNKGLLATRHGGGTFVTDRMVAPFTDPWQEMLAGHPALQEDLLEFRHMLEAQAAQLAAERATDADLRRLEAAHAAMEAAFARGDAAASVRSDVAFHQAIADAAHNVLIGHLSTSLLRVIHGHIERNVGHLQLRPQLWEQLQVQHRAIWAAISERRPEAAAESARRHIDFVRQSMADRAKEERRRRSALRRMG